MQPIEVHVTTAVELSTAQRSAITDALGKKYPKQKISLEATIDPEVIGGIRIMIDSVEYDATVAGKLERLSHHLQQAL